MALPPHQTRSAQMGSAGSTPASAIQVPTHDPALLGGGSSFPNIGGPSGNRVRSWFLYLARCIAVS